MENGVNDAIIIHVIKDYLGNREAISTHINESLQQIKEELERYQNNEREYTGRRRQMIEEDINMKSELIKIFSDFRLFNLLVDDLFYRLGYKKSKAVDLIFIQGKSLEVGKRELKCGYKTLKTLLAESLEFMVEALDDALKDRIIYAVNHGRWQLM